MNQFGNIERLLTKCALYGTLRAMQLRPAPYVVKELEIDGRRPFSEWFRKLKDKVAKATILGRLARLTEAGSVGDYRYLGEAVFELRVHQGPGYRIYFGVEQEQVVLLLLGGDKSSQSRDIAKATKLWKRYQEENADAQDTKTNRSRGEH